MMLYSSKDDFSYFHHETCVQSRDWQTFFLYRFREQMFQALRATRLLSQLLSSVNEQENIMDSIKINKCRYFPKK